MRIIEIENLNTVLEIDPDEARMLAAACQVGAASAEGSTLNVSPLTAFGSAGIVAMLLDSYAAMFEAASMAGTVHNEVPPIHAPRLTLSAIRREGTGARNLGQSKEEVAS